MLFSDAVKEEKISYYYNLFNKTNKMLKFIEKANSILHDLGTASNNTNLFEYEKIYECLEKWLRSENPQWRRMASAALAASGAYGVKLSLKALNDC